jgi:hypothetical protein
MNLRDRVQELLDFQKTNPTVEEIYEQFYDENVVVQENLQAPRFGRALHPCMRLLLVWDLSCV